MQTIRLSTTPGVVNPGAYLSQYDVGRQMLFLLYDDVGKYIPAAGSTVHIMATKPSGFGFDVACTWSQNSVTVTVTEDMSNESGSFGAELRIEKDDDILGTANFLWNVERSTHPDGTVDGNTEAEGLMQAIMAAITDAEDAAADARMSGLSEDFKQSLLYCFEHVAWVDDQGQTYYNALYDAMYPPVPATSITLNKSSVSFNTINAEETLIATVQPEDATESVYWFSSAPTVVSVDNNGKIKTLAFGEATITARVGNLSAQCSVLVSEVTVESIEAVFNQGVNKIYDNDGLDVLKQYLTVTATYTNSQTAVLDDDDYTLSGTLEAGTSTITVNYAGKTDTFTVTVTAYVPHFSITNNLSHVSSSNAGVTSVEQGESYITSLGVQVGYVMLSVVVTMGNTDITSTAYNDSTQQISIASVTGNVVITAAAVVEPVSIAAVFTQGGATIYNTDSLDSLKQYLAVTATYSDSSTATVPGTDYTLSGTLTVGTSTITVTYVGLTATFSVTVTKAASYRTTDLELWLDALKYKSQGITGYKNITDQSGNNVQLTFNNYTHIYFDDKFVSEGTRGQIKIADASFVQKLVGHFTIEAAFQNRYYASGDVEQPTDGGSGRVVSFVDGRGMLTANGRMQTPTSNTYLNSGVDLKTSNHTVAVVYDGTTLKEYIDGVQVYSDTKTINLANSTFLEFCGNISYAAQTPLSWNAFRVYSAALSAQDIEDNWTVDVANYGAINIEIPEP